MVKWYPTLKPLKPQRIDLYLLTEVAGPLVGGLTFFTFIFLMFQLLRLAEFLIVHGAPLLQLLQIATLLSATFLPFALPISFLIALLLGFGRLSSDSELIAMKAGGYSIARLAAAPAALALAVSAGSLALNFEWIPWTERTLKSTLASVGSTRIVSSVQEGTFTRGFFDLLVYADKVDSHSNRMEGVFIYDEREPKNPLTVVAKSGQWNTETDRTGTTTAVLLLRDGNIHRSESSEGSYQKIDFGEYRLTLKMDGGGTGFAGKPKMLPVGELKKAIMGLPKGHSYRLRLESELWRRVSVALAPLCMLLVGLGSGIRPTRSVRSGAALIAFAVLLVYYALLGLGAQLAEMAILPAWLSMQIGNLVILVWGWFSFRRV